MIRFILGFFIASVPWYAGAILLLCTRPDPRERIGFIYCTIAVSVCVNDPNPLFSVDQYLTSIH